MIRPEREFPERFRLPKDTAWVREPCSLTPSELSSWDKIALRHGGPDPLSSGSSWNLAYSDACIRGQLLFRQEAGAQLAYTIGRDTGRNNVLVLGTIEKNWRFGVCRQGPHNKELLADTLAEIAPGERVEVSGNDTDWIFRSASLEGGFDGWLSRRSGNFRKALKKSKRKAKASGVVLRRIDEPTSGDFDVMVSVDLNSWKGFQAGGLLSPGEFYWALMLRYARTGANRVVLATIDGLAVGYCWAGMINDQVRGQQCSYVESEAALGLGRVLHCELTQWVCEQSATRLHYGPDRSWMDAFADQPELL